jgi:hypothetical protein
MAEGELLELISIHRTESGFHATNFIAIMSGYIAAAYFVGRKLTTFQVSALTFLYTAIAPFPLVGSIQASYSAGNLYGKYSDLIDAPPLFSVIESGPLVIGGTMVLSWVVSIFFMFNVRRNLGDEKSA